MSTRRHAAQVTAERLSDAIEAWPGRFTKDEVKAARNLGDRLFAIAAHDRTDTETGWRCSCGAAVALAGMSRDVLDQLFDTHADPTPTEPTEEPAP